MKNNPENSIDNPIIDTTKSVKIDFRLPSAMKNMIISSAQKKGIKVSQFIMLLIENFYAAQAKQDRLLLEADKQEQLMIREKYAEYDRKKKHKIGDFSTDEPTHKIQNKSDDSALLNFLILIVAMVSAWQIFVFIKKNIERKKNQKLTQPWQSPQHSPTPKADSTPGDKLSEKPSPTA